jgi:ribosome recycling factor
MSSSLGLSVIVDDKGLRLAFPELTGERRADLVKLARQKLEDARKSLRKHREDIWEDIQTKEKSGGMSEDEKFRLKDEMQKIVDLSSDNLLKAIERKEQEIKS